MALADRLNVKSSQQHDKGAQRNNSTREESSWHEMEIQGQAQNSAGAADCDS